MKRKKIKTMLALQGGDYVTYVTYLWQYLHISYMIIEHLHSINFQVIYRRKVIESCNLKTLNPKIMNTVRIQIFFSKYIVNTWYSL